MNRQRTSLLLCFLFALCFMQSAHAQGIPSEGKDFYLGYIHPTFNDVVPARTAGYFRVYAYVSSFQENVVSVSYFDPITKREDFPANFPVKARQTTQIPLDRTRMAMKQPGDVAGEFKSCHITSKKPVNVQFFSTGANSGGSYLALPVNAWGKKYVVASYSDNGYGAGAWLGGAGPSQLDPAGGVFVVIAAYDGTEVEITPTARTGGDHWGVTQGKNATGKPQPYTVGLNRGQCWFVKSYSASQEGDDDISASIVKSNKPVAVIAGHEDANVGDGSVGGRTLEGRDYMVEQMIPVEYWDNTGHITIPMPDSPSNNGDGVGEDARIFVYDQNVPNKVYAERPGLVETNPGPYLPPSEFQNIAQPAHFYSDSGSKFMVVQYDLRNHGSGEPFPSPSMLSIVPRSMWRNAYLWYVPTNVNEKLQAYYITVIATKDGVLRYHEPLDTIISRNWFSDSIRVATNGSNTFLKVDKVGTQKKAWPSIPGHPDLRAVTYRVAPGTSYYMQAPFPFMVYNFGCRAVDSDGDLGDFDNDDNFFEYALPLGMALRVPVPRRISITVDTLCSGWRVCVHDSNNPGGIKSVTLLDDPNGDLIVGGHYQLKNTSFDPADDPLNLKEIVLNPPKTDFCFNVRVDNPGADAVAPLYVVDVNGNGKILQLNYKRAAVTFSPADTVGLTLQQFDQVSKTYVPNYIGEEVCKDYIFVNDKVSSKSFVLTKVDIPQPSPFKLKSVTPGVNSTINPGDTVWMTACFTGPDTMAYLDSIDFETDCFPTRLPLAGQAGTPLIVAEDYDFGTILIGTRKCHDIEVKNVGNKPFILDRNFIEKNFAEFIFDTSRFQNQLPRTLGPGQSHKFNFCYEAKDEGTDSGSVDWSTDIKAPFEKNIKSYSNVTGTGIKPGVNWDRATEKMNVICEADTIHRVNLINSSTADAQLTRIYFDGTDADEFSIVATEFNTNPPSYGGTVLTVGDTMWVDVRFTPDLSKTPKYRLRTANLKTSATLDSLTVPTIVFTGEIFHADPVLNTINATTPSDTVEYGYVVAGDTNCRYVWIKNTGNTPLVIESFIAPGRPYVNILPDLTPLLPFSIDTGETKSFLICGTMDTWGDTTVPFTLNYRDNKCSPSNTAYLHFKSTNNVVVLDIPDHPPTYLDCRTSVQPGTITNRGAGVDITLVSAEIVNGTTAPNDRMTEFTFVANGQRQISLNNKVLKPGESETVQVQYNPTLIGNAGAYLKFTWDSAGTKFTDSTILVAKGVQLNNTFSVENTSNPGQPYNALTGEFFTIPIRITDNIAGPQGAAPPGAHGATVTLTWRQDLFQFIDLVQAPGLDAPTKVSGPTPDGLGNESITIHVEAPAGSDITTAMNLLEVRFQLMIAKDLASDFTVSNGFFTDAAGAPICYIINGHIPAQFLPTDRCGDNVIRGFLNDIKPTSISYLNPNPVVPGSDLKLGYRVNVPLAPITIELFDVLGNKVRTLQAEKASAKGDHTATIATSGLAAGAYTVRLTGGDWTETTSFVIEK